MLLCLGDDIATSSITSATEVVIDPVTVPVTGTVSDPVKATNDNDDGDGKKSITSYAIVLLIIFDFRCNCFDTFLSVSVRTCYPQPDRARPVSYCLCLCLARPFKSHLKGLYNHVKGNIRK